MDTKTNAMRILDSHRAVYKSHSYAHTDAVSGVEVAAALGQDPRHVFKTLVTVAKSKKHYVFVIPVAEALDLKKAAASVDEKSVDMLPLKELFPLTGYIHGGCSPIGMKKQFATVIDDTALGCSTIVFSAGKIGYQIELTLDELKKALSVQFAPLTKAHSD